MHAHRAHDLLDSIGINCHWGYTDTPYHTRYGEVRALLGALGVPHERMGYDSRAFVQERYLDSLRAGIRGTILVDLPTPRYRHEYREVDARLDYDGEGGPEQLAAVLGWVRSLVRRAPAGSVVALEGPNEADLFWDAGNRSSPDWRSYRGQEGAAGAHLFQIDLAAAARADAELRGLTLIGPCHGVTYDPGGGKPNPWAPGSLADHVDWGNFHPYPFGGNVFTPQIAYAGLRHMYRDGNMPSGNLDAHPYAFETYGPPFGGKPMACTETGYPTHTGGSSEEAQGRYVPRLFAEYFRLGIKRTYLYELLDEFPDAASKEARFGILRRDLTPKPAFAALRSLIGKLSGSDPAAEEGEVDVRIGLQMPAGYDDEGRVHHLLLCRGAGEYVLLLWHEVPSERVGGELLSHPPVRATLTLPGGEVRRVDVRDELAYVVFGSGAADPPDAPGADAPEGRDASRWWIETEGQSASPGGCAVRAAEPSRMAVPGWEARARTGVGPGALVSLTQSLAPSSQSGRAEYDLWLRGGQYDVHILAGGESPSDDSVYVQVTGEGEEPDDAAWLLVNSRPEQQRGPRAPAWALAGSVERPAGRSTLHLMAREDGYHVRRIALVRSGGGAPAALAPTLCAVGYEGGAFGVAVSGPSRISVLPAT